MNTTITIHTSEDAIAILKKYITFKRQANAANAKAEELAPIALYAIESGMADDFKLEGYTATYQIFTDSAVDNCIEYQRKSDPAEIIDKDACVQILKDMGIPLPMKMSSGRKATIKAKSQKGTAEKRKKGA